MVSYDNWVADLAVVEPDQQRGFIIESLRNKAHLHIFGRYFFPHIIQGTADVPECHLALIAELARRADGAAIFPRGHSKTTWEKIDTIHDIVYQLEDLTLYIGDTMASAGQHFEAIKAELEGNRLLREIYGDIVPPENMKSRKWTNTHIQTMSGVVLVARGRNKGRGVNIRNRRPTKVIIDDAEDDQSVRQERQRIKFASWLNAVIFPSVDPKRGFVKMIGTTLHEHCELLRFYKKHGGIRRQAIENGKPIWPAMFSAERLAEQKEKIGTRAFNREYMNDPIADEEAKIKAEWIEKALYSTLPPEFAYTCVIHCDPQAGEKATADEYAITAVYGARQSPHRYVMEQVAGRASQMDQARNIVRVWLRHRRICRAVGVEKVLNQTSVYQILADWKAHKVDFNAADTPINLRVDESDRNMPLVAWSPKGRDKVARLEMVEPDFERGEIHLRPEMEELAHQLKFTVGSGDQHDDRADSCIGALEMLGRTAPAREPVADRGAKRYNGTVAGNLMGAQF